MKIYLAGPMSGLPDFNFPAFHAAAKTLREQGHEVFSPAEADLERWGDMETIKKEATYKECLKVDLDWIIANAEAIALLPGWEKSKGVAAELALSKALGLKEIYLER
jgi:nucleoside 2-deoxyribosyltransferase